MSVITKMTRREAKSLGFPSIECYIDGSAVRITSESPEAQLGDKLTGSLDGGSFCKTSSHIIPINTQLKIIDLGENTGGSNYNQWRHVESEVIPAEHSDFQWESELPVVVPSYTHCQFCGKLVLVRELLTVLPYELDEWGYERTNFCSLNCLCDSEEQYAEEFKEALLA